MRIDEKYPEEVKGLLALAREKGCLTRSEIRLQLPEELLADQAEMDELHDLLRAQEIDILEGDQELEAEDILGETLPPQIDVRRKNEPLPVGEQERTNDPVRMYLREMGTVPLLTREGEVAIAKRIEEGELKVLRALSQSRFGLDEILSIPDRLKGHPKAVEEMFEISEDALGAKGGTLTREELIRRKVNQANKRVAKIRRLSSELDEFVHRRGKLKDSSAARRRLDEKVSVMQLKIAEAIQDVGLLQHYIDRLVDRDDVPRAKPRPAPRRVPEDLSTAVPQQIQRRSEILDCRERHRNFHSVQDRQRIGNPHGPARDKPPHLAFR